MNRLHVKDIIHFDSEKEKMIFYKMHFKFFTASTGNSSRRNVVWQPADFRRLPASIDNPE